ncbi:outer membrane beta-barrel protein [Hymenobacter sublimis]|uniref:Outer membrane protein beta-barrel domain-containing protein n=1 Tax=Hymenobacter sublimis TaxID=2933777 RepID=A0ABY4JBZ5_9BACT|nr:hypothetical protein [Hymenobacter sublimis]UPL49301.1 hypothetical protein MWH26_19245 [Hymenobacter sublimis]
MNILPIGILVGMLAASSAAAQTEKGHTYLRLSAGNLSYSNQDQNQFGNEYRQIFGSLYPAVSRFVADNFLVGAEIPLRYGHTRYEEAFIQIPGVRSASQVDVGLGPFVRYYLPGTSNHRFFGQLNGSLGWQRQRQISTDDYPTGTRTIKFERTIDYQTYGAALGYNYFITPGAALEVAAGYVRSTLGPDRTNGSLDIRAGIAVVLPAD